MKLSHYMSSLIGVFFFGIIEVAMAITAFLIWKRHMEHISSTPKGIVCAVLCISLIFLTGMILLSSDRRPSTVDTSPLEELSEISVNNISKSICNLKHLPFEEYAEEKGPLETTVTISMYTYIMKDEFRIESAANINIYAFETKQMAYEDLHFWMGVIGRNYQYIDYANGISVIKRDSWMERGADTFYMAHDQRLVYTYFVINNYLFILGERSNAEESRGNLTSECIRMICDALRGSAQ